MKTILCPTDFTPVSQNALLYAVEFAKKSGATLFLFHTEFIQNNYPDEMINVPSENVNELKERLQSLVIQLKMTAPEVNYKYVLEEGLVAENIAYYSNKHSIDLVVMGTSGASGMDAIFAGSNAVKVMEKANCPILIVPEKFSYSPPKNFVYAADLLDNEEEVVDKILDITNQLEAALELIYIKSEDALELVASEVSMNKIASRHLGKQMKYKIINAEDSIEEIEEYAKANADILVMAQRKKSILERLFSRNRVEKIAYRAEIPLLVMHKS